MLQGDERKSSMGLLGSVAMHCGKEDQCAPKEYYAVTLLYTQGVIVGEKSYHDNFPQREFYQRCRISYLKSISNGSFLQALTFIQMLKENSNSNT